MSLLEVTLTICTHFCQNLMGVWITYNHNHSWINFLYSIRISKRIKCLRHQNFSLKSNAFLNQMRWTWCNNCFYSIELSVSMTCCLVLLHFASCWQSQLVWSLNLMGNHSVEICQFVDPLNFALCFTSYSPSSSWVRGHHPRCWDLFPVGSVFCSEPVLWHLLKGLHQAGISGESQLWAAAALRGFGPADFHQISPKGQPRGGGPGLFRGVRTP